MGKFIYIYRTSPQDGQWTTEIDRLRQCVPVIDGKEYIHQNKNQLLWCNNSGGIQLEGFSLQTGHFGTEPASPDYSFQLKVADHEISASADFTASRAIWYIVHQNTLMISSSQRMILKMLGDFKFNRQAASWMLCSGCLGFGQSWDERIRFLKPNTTLTFAKGELQKINSVKKSISESSRSLQEIFDQVFSHFQSNANLGITLSGGYDSRACIYYLKKHNIPVKSYSWGLPGSLELGGTDSNIAQKVADTLEIPFHFDQLYNESLSARQILRTFVLHGEGRNDHFNAFTDGLAMWSGFPDRNIDSIIRADEAFGWLKVSNDKDARISLELNKVEDFESLERVFELSSLQPPSWDEQAGREEGETLAAWRDRLYRNFRIPYILSGLHDPMLTFVELYNPLLHPGFIQWVLSQDDKDRTDKSKYKQFVEKLMPDIPVATIPSIPEPQEVLARPDYFNEIALTLQSQLAYDTLGQELVDFLLSQHQAGENHNKLENKYVRMLKNITPFWVKKFLRNNINPYKLSYNKLIFRAYITVAMQEIILNDIKK